MQACFVAIYPVYNRIVHDENSYTLDFTGILIFKIFYMNSVSSMYLLWIFVVFSVKFARFFSYKIAFPHEKRDPDFRSGPRNHSTKIQNQITWSSNLHTAW